MLATIFVHLTDKSVIEADLKNKGLVLREDPNQTVWFLPNRYSGDPERTHAHRVLDQLEVAIQQLRANLPPRESVPQPHTYGSREEPSRA